MLAGNGALLGDHIPSLGRLIQFKHPVMLDHRGTVLLCSTGIGQHRAGCIDITFAISPQPAKNAIHRHHRTQ